MKIRQLYILSGHIFFGHHEKPPGENPTIEVAERVKNPTRGKGDLPRVIIFAGKSRGWGNGWRKEYCARKIIPSFFAFNYIQSKLAGYVGCRAEEQSFFANWNSPNDIYSTKEN